MKWKCLDYPSFYDKCFKNYSVYDWFHRTASIYPITRGHFHILRLFPSSRTESYLSFKRSLRKECFMSTFSCLNTFLTLFPILRAKYYHQSTTNISVLAVLQCQAAFVGRNLFVPYKTKIYNNSQSVATYSSSPSRYSTTPSVSLWNEGIWLASDLLCPV